MYFFFKGFGLWSFAAYYFFFIVGSSVYFLRDAKYIPTIFFKFAPAGKYLHRVEFTYVGELLYIRQ